MKAELSEFTGGAEKGRSQGRYQEIGSEHLEGMEPLFAETEWLQQEPLWGRPVWDTLSGRCLLVTLVTPALSLLLHLLPRSEHCLQPTKPPNMLFPLHKMPSHPIILQQPAHTPSPQQGREPLQLPRLADRTGLAASSIPNSTYRTVS